MAQDRTGGAARRLAWLATALGVALAVAGLLVPGGGPAAVVAGPAGMAVVVWLTSRGLAAGYPHARMGMCNAVTMLRAGVVAGLLALLVVSGPVLADDRLAWGAVAVAALSLVLDGVDGALARAEGLTSAFGARFDMEVDAGLALVLSALVWETGKAGPAVLLLGGMRYLFVAATPVWRWLDRPLPPRAGRKTVCVIQIATLILLLAPPLQVPLSAVLAAGATLLLAGSFGLDVLWLWRRR